MIRINLIPVRAAKKREFGRQQFVLLALALALGVVGNYEWTEHVGRQVAEGQAQVARLTGEIDQLKKVIGQVNSITQEKKTLEDKLKVLDTLEKRRTGPVKVMDALSMLMPAHVWLTQVSDKGGKWVLAGMGLTNDDVAELLRELKRSPYFKDIVLEKVNEAAGLARENGSHAVQFEISCAVNYAV